VQRNSILEHSTVEELTKEEKIFLRETLAKLPAIYVKDVFLIVSKNSL